MESSYTSPSTKPLYRGTQVVWYVLGVIEALLAFRFVLRLLGANPEAAFTNVIYALSYIFTAPFSAVFGNTRIAAGSVFEWTTLLAMLVWWLLALGVIRMFLMGRTVSTPEAAARLDRQDPNM